MTDVVKVKFAVPKDLDKKGKDVSNKLRIVLQDVYDRSSEKAVEIMKKEMYRKEIPTDSKLHDSPVMQQLKGGSVSDIHFTGEMVFKDIAFEHWYFANYGRSPGKRPPIAPIARWMNKRGIDSKWLYWIRTKIANEGTKSRKFIEAARGQIRLSTESIWRSAILKFEKEIK